MTNIVEYDLSFWIKQNADETNAQKVCDEIQKKLQDKGFIIISVSIPNLKTLEEIINKEEKAYLATIVFGLGTGDLTGVKDIFSFKNDVLRFMVTRRDIRPEKPRNKRTRIGFRKPEIHDVKTTQEFSEEIKEQKEEEQIEEVATERPTVAKEEKEIDLNELDKKLDELLK